VDNISSNQNENACHTWAP